ncbi:MAG: glycoside hydrolase family 3 protein, partial [Lachnospiraceae bacterium]|nr:glycoside hydrolase family 3 protein [Lachnospiraceae bacterium]
MRKTVKKLILYGITAAMSLSLLSGCSGLFSTEAKIDRTVKKMSLDEKISQMIIPAIRTWNEEDVTDLGSFPDLKEALKKHQYGGVILFGANITGNEQITRLVHELQENNRQIEEASANIPYLTPLDEEGGIVIRLMNGTRMTGNMAIGATGDDALMNAERTGKIIGEELAAIGFNADYAPDIDVNNNPANPVIGTRSFSDDPSLVAELGTAYSKGLAANGIIATYKHFPGHGDTETDSHIGTPSVEKTYEEIRQTELVPFQEAIDNGADMIMTAHITYPQIDDEVTYGDGKTKGYYPATMSKKMITDILRKDMGFNGVVVTDALEMDAVRTGGLVPGEVDSAEYAINIAEQVINAGVDMLLLPKDMTDASAVTFYDDYISGLAAKVEAGEISEERINESVKRILSLKAKYGILDIDGKNPEAQDIEAKVAKCLETVGSEEHHETEMTIAKSAITLVKNADSLLPLSSKTKKIVFMGRLKDDAVTLNYAIEKLKEEGFISKDAEISVEYYYDPNADAKLNFPDDMKKRISSADVVIGCSYAAGNTALDKESPQYIALSSAIEDVHKGGGKFVLLSENLPYDSAIYHTADAIVLAYMGSALGTDPTEKAG